MAANERGDMLDTEDLKSRCLEFDKTSSYDPGDSTASWLPHHVSQMLLVKKQFALRNNKEASDQTASLKRYHPYLTSAASSQNTSGGNTSSSVKVSSSSISHGVVGLGSAHEKALSRAGASAMALRSNGGSHKELLCDAIAHANAGAFNVISIGQFVCSNCGTDFVNRDALAMHMMESVRTQACPGAKEPKAAQFGSVKGIPSTITSQVPLKTSTTSIPLPTATGCGSLFPAERNESSQQLGLSTENGASSQQQQAASSQRSLTSVLSLLNQMQQLPMKSGMEQFCQLAQMSNYASSTNNNSTSNATTASTAGMPLKQEASFTTTSLNKASHQAVNATASNDAKATTKPKFKYTPQPKQHAMTANTELPSETIAENFSENIGEIFKQFSSENKAMEYLQQLYALKLIEMFSEQSALSNDLANKNGGEGSTAGGKRVGAPLKRPSSTGLVDDEKQTACNERPPKCRSYPSICEEDQINKYRSNASTRDGVKNRRRSNSKEKRKSFKSQDPSYQMSQRASILDTHPQSLAKLERTDNSSSPPRPKSDGSSRPQQTGSTFSQLQHDVHQSQLTTSVKHSSNKLLSDATMNSCSTSHLQQRDHALRSSNDRTTFKSSRPHATTTADENNRQCEISINKDPVLNESVQEQPEVEFNYTFHCRHCEIGFRDQTLFSLHMGLHTVNRVWQCNMCGKHFKGRHEFASHCLHF